MPSVYLGNLTRLPAFMKLGEIIIFLIVIIMVEVGKVLAPYHAGALLYGIVIGYMIVYLILIICYLIGETTTQHTTFELLLNGIGSILFLSLSIKLIAYGADLRGSWSTQTIVVGVFLLMVVPCQLVDAVFNFKSRST
ncbi:uncharacterized protein LOC122373867 [Amphibalanus amphitrite]|uniref:uncharacterized protein LOC122373867 n=1 Tax=Amphibalanus amphitrite TaxID=1232801 RepID=UPI001C90A88C|nr:uncharacterized protein LOC122373867 [Amphibalanus amphitrite]